MITSLRNTLTVIVVTFLFAYQSLAQSKSDVVIPSTPSIPVETLLADYQTWWSNYYYEINLSLDFTPINAQGQLMDKKSFLTALTSGDNIPVAMTSEQPGVFYKLYRLPEDAIPSIAGTIRNVAATRLKHFEMEGEGFPNFDVIDIEGNILDDSSLDGKITVVKTWFIGCKPCVAEFPELNGLVREYEKNTNIQFISLALDPTSNLERFLDRKPFLYKVVANQKVLIQDELGLNAYPTHVVLNENRKIIKVVNKASELIRFLDDLMK